MLVENPYLSAVIIGIVVVGIIFGLAMWKSPNPQRRETVRDETTKQVRKMAAADTFYPKDTITLEAQLSKYLEETTKQDLSNPLRIVVVPHAGLVYSGSTAAAIYKQIAGGNYHKIIILGPSHYFAFSNAAIIGSGEWETPMGNVEIDADLANSLISPSQNISDDPAVFEKEHSVEMQVIWLKKVLSDFKIVPILLSQPTPEVTNALAYRIAQNMDDQTLVVISTDLSHYPNYETANRIDRTTINAILTGSKIEGASGVETTACGTEALKVAQKIAKLLGTQTPVLLKYQNSGDVSDNKDRVVGYAAIGYPADKLIFTPPTLSEEARKEALEIAKTTLSNFVSGKPQVGETAVTNDVLNDPLGAFITLKKDGELRGCVGEFEPAKPLAKVIAEKTIAAASQDPRFNPVTPEELADLTLEISVMSPKRKIDDWRQINLGRDGVVIKQGSHTGTFLPQVADETKWNLTQFMEQLCSQKAGLAKDCYLDPNTEIYTYQVQVF